MSRSVSAEPAAFGTAEVAAGGGYDSNMFLQVSPDATTREPILSGWFGHVEPRLGAALSAAGWRFDLSYLLDYRGSQAAGPLALQQIDFRIVPPSLGPVRMTLTETAGRFDASRFSADRFLFAGAGLELRVELAESVRATGGYRLELRNFPDRASEKDLVHLADLRLGYRPTSRVELGLGSTYFAVVPTSATSIDDGTVQVVRAGPELEVAWHPLSLALTGWGGSITVASGGHDWQVGGGLVALLRMTRHLDLTATVDVTAAPWADQLRAEAYTRRYVGVGLVGHVTGRTTVGHHDDSEELRPIVKDGRTRFRMKAPQAAGVTVVGSWDDWASPGTSLAPTREPGLWEAWVSLPAGVHRYRFLVDGRAVRPPDALRYVTDDFGGEDAVVEVLGGGAP